MQVTSLPILDNSYIGGVVATNGTLFFTRYVEGLFTLYRIDGAPGTTPITVASSSDPLDMKVNGNRG